MLIVSTTTTLCATVFINGVVFLIPALKVERHMGLAEGALWSATPSLGMAATLFAWGYLLDRIGERIVLTVGLALTAAAAFAAASVDSSGRLVTGWFPPEQRGVAMGIRQTAQPLGIALAALVMPELAKRNFSLALLFPAVLCAVAAAASAVGVLDPPRSTRQAADDRELANPYRGPGVLWRIHVASALLVVPQNVVLTFMLVWLIGVHGWSTASAGGLLAVSQLLGALARTAAGRWSDRVGSRMRPIRVIAVATTVVMVLLALTDHLGWSVAVAAMLAAGAITGDNGLPFIAIPEYAGPFWSGRALGAQHTAERLVFAAAPPLFGALITAVGYPLTFAVCGLFPLAALPFVPVGTRAR